MALQLNVQKALLHRQEATAEIAGGVHEVLQ